MEQRDYFMREIEKLGSVLVALISRFAGKEEPMSNASLLSDTKLALSELLSMDYELVLHCDPNEISALIQSHKGLDVENLIKLADLFVVLGEHSMTINDHKAEAENLFERAYLFYENAQKNRSSYSLPLADKMERLKQRLT